MRTVSVQASANIFAQPPAQGGEPKRPTLEIDAYGGGPINVAGYGRPVVIDLGGLRLGRVTILRDHVMSQIVGQGEARIAKGRLRITGTITGDIDDPDDPAHDIITHARNGFVWAASVGVEPDKVEEIDPGRKDRVNGRNLSGPITVVRSGRLVEVSLLGVGADASAEATIAAVAATNRGEMTMTFEEWMTQRGMDGIEITEEQRASLRAEYDAETAANRAEAEPDRSRPPADEKPVGDDPLAKLRASAAAETLRIAAIQRICGGAHAELAARAIAEGWSEERTELAVLRAARPKPLQTDAAMERASSPPAIVAGICLSGRLPSAEKVFRAEVLEEADRRYRGWGLQEFILAAARANGYDGRARITSGNAREILRAAFSTADLSGILSDAANKFLLAGFTAVESAWREIAAIRAVRDFKTITSYRLTGGGGYEQVGPDGEIKHGTLAEESFTNRADTYGEILAITRQDLINDNLGALTTGPQQKLGRDAGRKLNTVFWTEFLDNSTFFSEGHKNLVTSNGLSLNGLTAAVAKFLGLKDTDGHPLAVRPSILLVPPALAATADAIYASTYVNEGATAGSPAPAANPHAGRYRPVMSAYLADTTITGNSATSWYVLASPADLPVIEVCFLNGQDSPTIESADADFNVLGIQLRGYFDFGVAKQDYRGGVRSNA